MIVESEEMDCDCLTVNCTVYVCERLHIYTQKAPSHALCMLACIECFYLSMCTNVHTVEQIGSISHACAFMCVYWPVCKEN